MRSEMWESGGASIRGPRSAVNLRARNLTQFLALAEEISDEVWDHHLRAGDCSAWFRDVIRDKELGT